MSLKQFHYFFPSLLLKILETVPSRVFELIFVAFTFSDRKMPFFLESFAFSSQFQVPNSIFHFSLEPLIIFF